MIQSDHSNKSALSKNLRHEISSFKLTHHPLVVESRNAIGRVDIYRLAVDRFSERNTSQTKARYAANRMPIQTSPTERNDVSQGMTNGGMSSDGSVRMYRR